MVPFTAMQWHYESSTRAQETNPRLLETWRRTSAWMMAMSAPWAWPGNAAEWMDALLSYEREELPMLVEALGPVPRAHVEPLSAWRVVYADGVEVSFTPESLGAALGIEGPVVASERPYWNGEASAMVCAHIQRGFLGTGIG